MLPLVMLDATLWVSAGSDGMVIQVRDVALVGGGRKWTVRVSTAGNYAEIDVNGREAGIAHADAYAQAINEARREAAK